MRILMKAQGHSLLSLFIVSAIFKGPGLLVSSNIYMNPIFVSVHWLVFKISAIFLQEFLLSNSTRILFSPLRLINKFCDKS